MAGQGEEQGGIVAQRDPPAEQLVTVGPDLGLRKGRQHLIQSLRMMCNRVSAVNDRRTTYLPKSRGSHYPDYHPSTPPQSSRPASLSTALLSADKFTSIRIPHLGDTYLSSNLSTTPLTSPAPQSRLSFIVSLPTSFFGPRNTLTPASVQLCSSNTSASTSP